MVFDDYVSLCMRRGMTYGEGATLHAIKSDFERWMNNAHMALSASYDATPEQPYESPLANFAFRAWCAQQKTIDAKL